MKRLVITLVLLAVLLTGCARHIRGDVDGNGIVDGRDSVRLMKYLSGENVEITKACADVTGDGIVDECDEQYLVRILAIE